MGVWLEGKSLADKVKEEIREQVGHYRKTRNQVPGLVAVLVGENRASQIYVRTKEKTSFSLGIASEVQTHPADISLSALKEKIGALNERDDVDGILVQLPLPSHLDAHEIICSISPGKDVDGFHPSSLGNLLMNREGLRPCTPLGIMELLKFHGISVAGQDVVIIGRSFIVGKPLAAMMTNENGTVTICHSKTKDLPKVAARADILVAAMGKAVFVSPEFAKPGATVIDVGINQLADLKKAEELFGDDVKRRKDIEEKGYTIVGDVDPRVIEKAAFLTPVPGGVGPLTVAMLMKNTLEAFIRRRALA